MTQEPDAMSSFLPDFSIEASWKADGKNSRSQVGFGRPGIRILPVKPSKKDPDQELLIPWADIESLKRTIRFSGGSIFLNMKDSNVYEVNFNEGGKCSETFDALSSSYGRKVLFEESPESPFKQMIVPVATGLLTALSLVGYGVSRFIKAKAGA